MKKSMLPLGTLLSLLFMQVSSFAAVRTYYCNWANNTWSAPTNWIPTGTPQNGDALIFPASSPNKTSLNDLLNLKLDSIQVTGSGYTISGNGLTISNGLAFTGVSPVVFYPALTLGNSQTISASPAGTSVQLYGGVNLNGFNLTLLNDGYLELQGAVSGNGNVTKSGAGQLFLAGSPNSFNGTLTHFSGELDLAKSPALPTNFVSYAHTVIYNQNATHTNGDVTLYTGALLGCSGTVTNTIRNLNMTGARIEAVQLTLGLRGNLTTFAAPTNSTIITQLDLQNTNHLFTIADGLADPDLLIYAGSVFGGTSAGFTKLGNGKLQLFQITGSYGGTNYVNAGILEIGLSVSLGGGAPTVINDGASLQLQTTGGFVEDLELHGNGVGGTNGVIRSIGFVEYTGTINLPTDASIRADGPMHAHGAIAGIGNLRLTGTNEFWTHGAANTLSGQFWVESGKFVLDKLDGVTAVGSVLVIGTNSVLVAPGATVQSGASNQVAGNVIINSSGRYELNTKAESPASLVMYGGAEVMLSGGVWTLQSDLEVFPDFLGRSAIFHAGGYLNVGSGTRKFIVHDAFSFSADPIELDLADTDLTGSANIFKEGDGDMRLVHVSSFTGNLNIEEGDIIDGFPNVFGSSGTGTYVSGPGALVLNTISDTEPITFNGTGRVDSASLMIPTGGTWRALMTLLQNTRVFVASNALFICHSPVTGPGGIIKEGPGEMLLDWDRTNTFTGGLFVKDGLVRLYHANTNQTIVCPITIGDGVGAAASAQLLVQNWQQIGDDVDVTMLGDGRFTVTNLPDAEIVRTLNGAGQLLIQDAALRISDNGSSSTFSGLISGSGGLVKAGTGRLTLSGLCNASGMTLTMLGGVTAINGTWAGSPGATLIDAYSGTTLAGQGSVQDVNIRSGATFSPGNSPGVFAANNVTLNAGANLFMELHGNQPGYGYDQLIIKNSISVSNAFLTLSLNFPPSEGQVFRLVDNQGAQPVKGTFSGKPEGSIINLSGNEFFISYVGGTGNDITLVATNTELALAAAIIPSGNGLVDAGECNELLVVLTNKTGSTLSGVTATLDSRSPAIAVSQQAATYPAFAGHSTRTNNSAFRISSLPGFECGQLVELQLTVTIPGAGTFAIPVALTTGTLSPSLSYSPGGAFGIAIPDAGTTNTSLPVLNFPSRVGKVTVSVHITHTFDADLRISLKSPSGTIVQLVTHRGASGDNFGTNCAAAFMRTTFDDSAANNIASGAAPFVGTFRPEDPLAAFIGEPANGNWQLMLADDVAIDTGTLDCWTLNLSPATCAPDSVSPCQSCQPLVAGTILPQSPTMPQRINCDANPSVCGETKLCPGSSASPGPFRYNMHTLTNTGPGGCVTVVLQSNCHDGSLLATACASNFNPSDLCGNYLADTGTNALASSMSFYVASNGVFTVVVNEISPGGGCANYHLELFGLPCPAPTLHIERAGGGNARLFWSAIGSDGYALQSAPSAIGSFTDVGVTPAYLNGSLSVTNPTSTPQKFFRLKKP